MIQHMKACRFDCWEPCRSTLQIDGVVIHDLGWAAWENPRYFIMCYDGTLTAIDKRDGSRAYQGESLEELQLYCDIAGNAWGQVYSE